MGAILNVSVELEAVQELAKGIEPYKNGKTYVPVTVFVSDELNRIGKQVELKQSTTKEEREALKADGQYPATIGSGYVGKAGEVVKAEDADLPF